MSASPNGREATTKSAEKVQCREFPPAYLERAT